MYVDKSQHAHTNIARGPYPGFIELSPTRALVYYSSRKRDDSDKTITAVYPAEPAIDE